MMFFLHRCAELNWLFIIELKVCSSWLSQTSHFQEPKQLWCHCSDNWLNLPCGCNCVSSPCLCCREGVRRVLAQIQVASQLHRWYERNAVACARPKWCLLAHAYRNMIELVIYSGSFDLCHAADLLSFIISKCCFSIDLRCKYWNRTYKHMDAVCVWLYPVLDHPICLHLILPKTASGLGLHGNRNPPCLISV